jgi:hypothetical protein
LAQLLGRSAFCLTLGGLLIGWVLPLAAQISGPGERPALLHFDPYGDFENSLVFFPSRFPQGNWNPPLLPLEDAWFTAADRVRLHGWYLPQQSPRAVALYCHGNAGNLSDWTRFPRLAAIMAPCYRAMARRTG